MNNDDGKKPNKPYLKTNKIGGIAFEFTCTYDGEEREGIEIEEKKPFPCGVRFEPTALWNQVRNSSTMSISVGQLLFMVH